jgi:Transposase, Mutator family
VVEKLAALRLTRAAELVGAAVEETLTYYAFPEEHWRRIRTTDVIDKPFRAGSFGVRVGFGYLSVARATAWRRARQEDARLAARP